MKQTFYRTLVSHFSGLDKIPISHLSGLDKNSIGILSTRKIDDLTSEELHIIVERILKSKFSIFPVLKVHWGNCFHKDIEN